MSGESDCKSLKFFQHEDNLYGSRHHGCPGEHLPVPGPGIAGPLCHDPYQEKQ
jgi:hypothetical protein